MKTAVINFKVDPKLKALAQKRAKKLGVPLSSVLHTQLYSFAQGNAVTLPAEPITPQLEKLLDESFEDIAKGKLSPAFEVHDTKNMKRWLEAANDD
ncbi:MAG: hypothetical protein U5K77_01905 [Candidatus Saccharibacteria bacterium]|nr:hypothetical protein [Candidatus Saccharibacteria bacterium]